MVVDMEMESKLMSSLKDLSLLDSDNLQDVEKQITTLASMYSKAKQANDLFSLIQKSRSLMPLISKARAAKMLRCMVDYYLDINGDPAKDVLVCKDSITWAKAEKRVYLRQALQCRLIKLECQ